MIKRRNLLGNRPLAYVHPEEIRPVSLPFRQWTGATQRDERRLAEAGEEAVVVMMNCRQESEVQKTRMNTGYQIRIRVDLSICQARKIRGHC